MYMQLKGKMQKYVNSVHLCFNFPQYKYLIAYRSAAASSSAVLCVVQLICVMAVQIVLKGTSGPK